MSSVDSGLDIQLAPAVGHGSSSDAEVVHEQFTGSTAASMQPITDESETIEPNKVILHDSSIDFAAPSEWPIPPPTAVSSAPLAEQLFHRTLSIHPVHQAGAQTISKRTMLHVILCDRITDEQFLGIQSKLQQPLMQLFLVTMYALGTCIMLSHIIGNFLPHWTAFFVVVLPTFGMIARLTILNVDLAALVMREFECWFLMANNLLLVLSCAELFNWDMRTFILPSQFFGTAFVIFGDAILISRPRMLTSQTLAVATLMIVWLCLVTGNTCFDYSRRMKIASYEINLVDFMTNRALTIAGFFSKTLYIALRWPDCPVTFRPMFHFQTNTGLSTTATTSASL